MTQNCTQRERIRVVYYLWRFLEGMPKAEGNLFSDINSSIHPSIKSLFMLSYLFLSSAKKTFCIFPTTFCLLSKPTKTIRPPLLRSNSSSRIIHGSWPECFGLDFYFNFGFILNGGSRLRDRDRRVTSFVFAWRGERGWWRRWKGNNWNLFSVGVTVTGVLEFHAPQKIGQQRPRAIAKRTIALVSGLPSGRVPL